MAEFQNSDTGVHVAGSQSKAHYFSEKEQNCESAYRSTGAPIWHLFTSGRQTPLLFESENDFRAAINALGIASASYLSVIIYAYAFMSNHVHLIISGSEEDVLALFNIFRRKLLIRFSRSEVTRDFSHFNPQLIEIAGLDILRKEIVYVNRNGYVVSPDCTPFTYSWTSGTLYYNHSGVTETGIRYAAVSKLQKRFICGGRHVELPENYYVTDGMIDPRSFCRYELGERFFRDAHHYFNMLTKQYEAYSLIAERLGDTVFLTDYELYPAVCEVSRNKYDVSKPSNLTGSQKIEMARLMHGRYKASNAQIRRILRLDIGVVEELFPGK